MTRQRRCAGKTRNGQRCKMYPMQGSKFCFTHNPRAAKQRKTARSNGGKSRTRAPGGGPPVDASSIVALQKRVGQALADVALLPNSAAKAQATARLVSVASQLIYDNQIEPELRTISEKIESIRRQGWGSDDDGV